KSLKTISLKETEIAFFGGSFTGISEDEQNKFLEIAQKFVKAGKVSGVRISTRPDLIDENTLSRLKQYGVSTIELGAQSMSDEVLTASERGHGAGDVRRASKLILDFGFKLGLQMMTGLPKSSDESDIYTAREFIKLKPHFVRIYPALVLQGTKLHEMYLKKEYAPQEIDKAVSLCAKLFELFYNADIPVIRMGLLGEDGKIPGFVAGPYHPSFGELVKQEFVLNKLFSYIKQHKPKTLEARVNERYLSILLGYKKKNQRILKDTFGIDLKYIIDNRTPAIELPNLTINRI
ncbi:MAG: radical SAM protein, partial [Clostridiaceae bacterium]|nr:radical SAM protein [Clostridiaceae bacterium]